MKSNNHVTSRLSKPNASLSLIFVGLADRCLQELVPHAGVGKTWHVFPLYLHELAWALDPDDYVSTDTWGLPSLAVFFVIIRTLPSNESYFALRIEKAMRYNCFINRASAYKAARAGVRSTRTGLTQPPTERRVGLAWIVSWASLTRSGGFIGAICFSGRERSEIAHHGGDHVTDP